MSTTTISSLVDRQTAWRDPMEQHRNVHTGTTLFIKSESRLGNCVTALTHAVRSWALTMRFDNCSISLHTEDARQLVEFLREAASKLEASATAFSDEAVIEAAI